jgi:hypothetical protein
MKTIPYYPGVMLFLVMSLWTMACAPKQGQQKLDEPASGIDEVYKARGAEVTTAVFQHLSGKLKSALMTDGVSGAVEFCNLAASPLVDSLKNVYHVNIKRTSHRLRNPGNQADAQERAVIDDYRKLLENQDIPTSKVVVESEVVHYYAPIMMMDNCLKCHGSKGQDIVAADYEVIKRLYPADEAIDFKVGDLRGIWSLTFDR